jgi:AbrB family looped-hinge helix DNA binding protein
MELVKVNAKGQLVIPSKIRKEFEITKESVLAIGRTKGHIVIKKIDEDLLNQITKSLEDIKHGRISEWKD